MAGLHELGDLAPRDVVAKAILRRMHETGTAHMWLDAPLVRRGPVGGPLPDDPREVPRARDRPGDRPDPRRPRVPLRLRRGADRPGRPLVRAGPVRLRRGRLLRRPRREPARVQLAARGPRLLRAHRRRPAPRAAARAASRRPTRAPRGLVSGSVRGGAAADHDGGRRRPAHARRDAPGDGRPRPAGNAQPRRAVHRVLGGHEPADDRDGCDRRRGAAEETRGSHWREDFPYRDDAAWRGHLDASLDDGTPDHDLQLREPRGPVARAGGRARRGGPGGGVRPSPPPPARCAEDLGYGDADVTSVATVPGDQRSVARRRRPRGRGRRRHGRRARGVRARRAPAARAWSAWSRTASGSAAATS